MHRSKFSRSSTEDKFAERDASLKARSGYVAGPNSLVVKYAMGAIVHESEEVGVRPSSPTSCADEYRPGAEPLERWVTKHFAMTVEQLLAAMWRKPLREFTAVFSWKNRCRFQCSHCFMVKPDGDGGGDVELDFPALLGPHGSPAVAHETYLYAQDTVGDLPELLELFVRYPQTYLEKAMQVTLKEI